MREQVLEFLNSKIREEHGNRITIESMWTDANVDSFGTTMVFLDMEEKYDCFPKEWFQSNMGKWNQLTVREIVERVLDEGNIL
jgi:acyl carrier protein